VVGFLLAVLFREFDRGNISAGVSYGFPFKGKWGFVLPCEDVAREGAPQHVDVTSRS
jgi:hypothetical protein